MHLFKKQGVSVCKFLKFLNSSQILCPYFDLPLLLFFDGWVDGGGGGGGICTISDMLP